MTRGSFIRLAPTHGDNDLQLIAVLDQGFPMEALRHDRAIALDGHLLARHLKLFQQLAHVHRSIEPMRGAVHHDLNHGPNFTAGTVQVPEYWTSSTISSADRAEVLFHVRWSTRT